MSGSLTAPSCPRGLLTWRRFRSGVPPPPPRPRCSSGYCRSSGSARARVDDSSSSSSTATHGPSPPRRVVITGMGAVTPLGSTLTETWQQLLLGTSGVTTLEQALRCQYSSPDDDDDDDEHQAFQREWEMARNLPCQVAAPVRSLPPDFRVSRHTSRGVQFALAAAEQAIQQAQLQNWWQPIPSTSSTPSTTLQAPDLESREDPLQQHQDPRQEEPDWLRRRQQRAGVCLGQGMVSVRDLVQAAHTLQEQGPRRLSPHFVPQVLLNAAAGRVAIQYGLRGPNLAPSTACAAGNHALGQAYQLIQSGQADVMVAGATEACLDLLTLAGFGRLRALSSATAPAQASRPFDRQRQGFVLAEGAAVLVLEEYEHALQRQRPERAGPPTIWAEVMGFGCSADAFHITAPDPDGRGAAEAMQLAWREVQQYQERHGAVVQHDLGSGSWYVNAHATSTPKGDDIEARTIDRVIFGRRGPSDSSDTTHPPLLLTGNKDKDNSSRGWFQQHAAASLSSEPPPVWVSSTKGATGHLLGASGALEAAFCALALHHQQIPHTVNLQSVDDPTVRFQHVLDRPISLGSVKSISSSSPPPLEMAVNNSFGFGGTNACLILKRFKEDL